MKLLSLGELKEIKGIPYSRSHIYRLVARGEFPAPIHLSKNRIGFIEEEIDHWIQQRIEDRDRVTSRAKTKILRLPSILEVDKNVAPSVALLGKLKRPESGATPIST